MCTLHGMCTSCGSSFEPEEHQEECGTGLVHIPHAFGVCNAFLVNKWMQPTGHAVHLFIPTYLLHLSPVSSPSDLVLLLGDDSKYGRKRVEDICRRAVECGPRVCATAVYAPHSRVPADQAAVSFGDMIVPLLQVLVKVSTHGCLVLLWLLKVSERARLECSSKMLETCLLFVMFLVSWTNSHTRTVDEEWTSSLALSNSLPRVNVTAS